MSESAIADFVTSFIPDTATHAEPVRGRVVMSKRRIVLATDSDRITIPLKGVFDVQHDTAPGDLAEFFDDTVTVAYERDGERHVAVIEGAGDTVERFVILVFKGLLNGSAAHVKHPARRGGRITDQPFESAKLAVSPGTVELRGDAATEIDVSTVTHFERVERELGGSTRQLLSVRHMGATGAVTTEIALDSGREMNLLGRFIRLRYTKLKQELADVELTDEEIEALIAIYSGGSNADLATVLGVDASQLTMFLNDLIEKALVRDDDGVHLTSMGRAAVSEHIEDVNM
ncbi:MULTISPECIES: CheF family chemotaxis protein [Halobacterium]|uniref:CheF family chemotaxis protein n=1 Tax=Halobacterium TaxID=2239 RepID=UPI00073F54CB|nr:MULTISPECIES: CheF family chemotaxis protein [Halobacterium]MCG1002954.1 CheF family chemotaxis protein [Halobacterium noricense]